MLTEGGTFSQTTGITMTQNRIQETFYAGLQQNLNELRERKPNTNSKSESGNIF